MPKTLSSSQYKNKNWGCRGKSYLGLKCSVLPMPLLVVCESAHSKFEFVVRNTHCMRNSILCTVARSSQSSSKGLKQHNYEWICTVKLIDLVLKISEGVFIYKISNNVSRALTCTGRKDLHIIERTPTQKFCQCFFPTPLPVYSFCRHFCNFKPIP